MRFIALVSGGKDSVYAIVEAIRAGHELVGCLHLGAPDTSEEESYMYQTAASSTVQTLVQDCLQVEFLLYQRTGKSINTGLVYEATSEQDEVEDLFLALQMAKERFENLEGVCSGAILSTYQRVRIENVCSRLGLTSLSYLWRLLPQKELLQRMLQDGIEAVLVKTACPPGLLPRRHLNKTLRFLWDTGLLQRLHERYQFHVCGEGGEYESLVLDSPIHKKKLVLDDVEIVEAEEDGVGELSILRCHAQEKDESDIPVLESLKQSFGGPRISKSAPSDQKPTHNSTNGSKLNDTPSVVSLPHVHLATGGLLHVSEILAPVASNAVPMSTVSKTEVEASVEEAREIFSILNATLQSHGATARDILFVHLYLSEISHFGTINTHYRDFFGVVLPPSRSCVAVGKMLPGGRRVLLDCMVQLGSGDYVRSVTNSTNSYTKAALDTKTSKLREVLHVQSISHWAPVCVGPYSQTNTLRSALHFLAGQIGLLPSTMTLRETWVSQLEQCWSNVARVLDALKGGSLNDVCGSLIYISDEVLMDPSAADQIETITTNQLLSNGSVVPGLIDTLHQSATLHGGYEDEGTWEEMKEKGAVESSSITPCPTLVVCIAEMPKDASVEVEVIAATKDASMYLRKRDSDNVQSISRRQTSTGSFEWNTGDEFADSDPVGVNSLVESHVRVLGHGCAAIGVAMVLIPKDRPNDNLGRRTQATDSLIRSMVRSIQNTLADARSGLSKKDIIHVRLFYATR